MQSKLGYFCLRNNLWVVELFDVWSFNTVNWDRHSLRLNLWSSSRCYVYLQFPLLLPLMLSLSACVCHSLNLIVFLLLPSFFCHLSLCTDIFQPPRTACGHGFAVMGIDFPRCTTSEATLHPDQAWASHAVRGSRCRPAQTKLWH